MAIKPTIYKLSADLTDINRDVYQSVQLTIAQHPSETTERMMARILAFCLNQTERLEFCKGLSDVDEPDIWEKSLDDQILLWIELGEPSVERIKKATRLAKRTLIYSFNSKSEVWWQGIAAKAQQLAVEVIQFNWQEIESLAALCERTMHCSITITGNSAYIATEKGECEVNWNNLKF
ncbi:YaeQ family protein [Aliikangiella sp. IMCC44653]